MNFDDLSGRPADAQQSYKIQSRTMKQEREGRGRARRRARIRLNVCLSTDRVVYVQVPELASPDNALEQSSSRDAWRTERLQQNDAWLSVADGGCYERAGSRRKVRIGL